MLHPIRLSPGMILYSCIATTASILIWSLCKSEVATTEQIDSNHPDGVFVCSLWHPEATVTQPDWDWYFSGINDQHLVTINGVTVMRCTTNPPAIYR
jgi:hypothetical protein